MRLQRVLSCAFCASIFSLSASGYTITSATASYFDWIWPAGDPFPTTYDQSCSNNGNTASWCEVQGLHAGARGMAFADSYSISVAVGLGADEIDSGAAASASASIDDWFAFTPDPGQNAPVAARIELRVLPSVQGSEIRWRGTFQGSELPYTNFTFFDTVPYTGDPFEVTVTGMADASINPYEGGTGGVEMYL